jgi:hypothetical protein
VGERNMAVEESSAKKETEEVKTIEESESHGKEENGGVEDEKKDAEKEKPPLQEWQKVGTEETPVSVYAHVKVKNKLKGAIQQNEDKDKEIESLKAKLSAYENGSTISQGTELKMPKEEDFDYDSDKYHKALAKYNQDLVNESVQKVRREEAESEMNMKIREGVDKHYARSAALVEEFSIDPELFRSADSRIRTVVNEVYPGQGDNIVDRLINDMGEGSEKVIYNIGQDPTKQAVFQNLLRKADNGISAAMFLGEQKAKFNSINKSSSKASAPEVNITGGDSVKGASDAIASKRKYDEYHKAGEVGKAFSIKRAAKKAGVDTSSWAAT